MLEMRGRLQGSGKDAESIGIEALGFLAGDQGAYAAVPGPHRNQGGPMCASWPPGHRSSSACSTSFWRTSRRLKPSHGRPASRRGRSAWRARQAGSRAGRLTSWSSRSQLRRGLPPAARHRDRVPVLREARHLPMPGLCRLHPAGCWREGATLALRLVPDAGGQRPIRPDREDGPAGSRAVEGVTVDEAALVLMVPLLR